MENYNLKEEREKIESYIITTCITLLGGFLIILSLSKSMSIISIYAASISIFCFVFTLLFSFWNKYRIALRKTILKRKHEQLMEKSIQTIKKFVDHVGEFSRLKAKEWINKHKDEFKNKNKEQISELLDKSIPKVNEFDYMTEVIASVVANDANKNYVDSISKPLDEHFAKIKFFLDYLSKNLRYPLFIIGLISFVVSIIFNMILI